MKIAVVGSINIDVIYQVERMPLQGETMFGHSYELLNGGKGANQAVILSALEDNVLFLGAVGSDAYAKQSLDNFKKIELDQNIVQKEGNSGVAIIQVASKDNSIVVIKGANNLLSKEDVDSFLDSNKDINYVVTQLEINLETIEYLVNQSHKRGIKVILNPAPATSLSKELVSKVDYLIPNETEAELIYKTNDLHKIVKENLGKVLITMGSNGVLYYDGSDVKTVPARKINVIDTTGAGDSFIAGFTSGISQGLPLKEAIQKGIDVASITCTQLGAQTSYQTVKDTFHK